MYICTITHLYIDIYIYINVYRHLYKHRFKMYWMTSFPETPSDLGFGASEAPVAVVWRACLSVGASLRGLNADRHQLGHLVKSQFNQIRLKFLDPMWSPNHLIFPTLLFQEFRIENCVLFLFFSCLPLFSKWLRLMVSYASCVDLRASLET